MADRYEFLQIVDNILYYKNFGYDSKLNVLYHLLNAVTLQHELLPIFHIVSSEEGFYSIYCTLNKKYYSVFLNGHRQK